VEAIVHCPGIFGVFGELGMFRRIGTMESLEFDSSKFFGSVLVKLLMPHSGAHVS
jgi:hypothetical protein